MPKGQKLIDWTPENDARLMLTILAVENVHPNCEAVAAAFGNGLNAMAVSNRLSRLRKKVADEGFTPRVQPVAITKGRKRTAPGTKEKAGNKSETVSNDAEADSSLHDRGDSANPTTPSKTPKNQKVLTGRVTKVRLPAKQKTKAIVISSDDDDDGAAAELGSVELSRAEESDGTVKAMDEEEDAVDHVKAEGDDA